MKLDEAVAEVELRFGDKSVKLKAVMDTGAGRSIMSKALSDKLGSFTPLKEPYDLRTADEGGRLRIIGYSRVGVIFSRRGGAWRSSIRGCGKPEERRRPNPLCKLKLYLWVFLLIYGETMSKVIKFVRERTPFILIVYGAYIYFVRTLRELLQIF